MRIAISLPDQLASRFFALVPNRECSATIARLLEQEFAQRESALLRSPHRHDAAAWGNLMGKLGADARSGVSQDATFASDSSCGAAFHGSAAPRPLQCLARIQAALTALA
jgi:hypothetical protein